MKPRNLTIVIWDNGIYQITGKQAAATGGVTDIVAVARGARLDQPREFLIPGVRGIGAGHGLSTPVRACRMHRARSSPLT